jgi:hypothetical protein
VVRSRSESDAWTWLQSRVVRRGIWPFSTAGHRRYLPLEAPDVLTANAVWVYRPSRIRIPEPPPHQVLYGGPHVDRTSIVSVLVSVGTGRLVRIGLRAGDAAQREREPRRHGEAPLAPSYAPLLLAAQPRTPRRARSAHHIVLGRIHRPRSPLPALPGARGVPVSLSLDLAQHVTKVFVGTGVRRTHWLRRAWL